MAASCPAFFVEIYEKKERTLWKKVTIQRLPRARF